MTPNNMPTPAATTPINGWCKKSSKANTPQTRVLPAHRTVLKTAFNMQALWSGAEKPQHPQQGLPEWTGASGHAHCRTSTASSVRAACSAGVWEMRLHAFAGASIKPLRQTANRGVQSACMSLRQSPQVCRPTMRHGRRLAKAAWALLGRGRRCRREAEG